ncbi:MAG: glucose 1-dehydrogenase [Chloroflexota bacterium]
MIADSADSAARSTPSAADRTMRAIAVHPGTAGSIHSRDVPRPAVADVPDGRGVLVRVLRVGVDGTDHEIVQAEYGRPPEGDDFLIIGHENLGEVVEVGPNVAAGVRPGSLVVSTVRRPGHSIYDRIGRQDVTLDDVYYERGINLLHGYLSEWYVEDAAWVVPLAPALSSVGVLLEPTSVAEKGIGQAYAIQRRLPVWRPEHGLVIGAGTIGLLAALILRLRGLEVTVYSRRRAPYLNSDLVDALGATYASSSDRSLADVAHDRGPFDVIFEASGFSPLVWEAAEVLGKNGVLVLSSVTGGDRRVEIASDRINEGFVLGNKVMVGTVNASRDDFERGADDLVLAESRFSGWLERLLTTPVSGLDDAAAILAALEDAATIKAYVEIAAPSSNIATR